MGVPMNDDRKSQKEGGQAATLRDQRKINDLHRHYDLKDPNVALEIYEELSQDPYYFSTDLGKQFLRGLLRTAIHSDQYLDDETAVSGRVEKSTKEHKRKHRSQKRITIRADKEERVERILRRRHKKRVMKVVVLFLLLILILIFGKSIYEIIDYEIKSYQSEKKIENLISCILEPVDAYVSEEHRIDDMLVSGLDPYSSAKDEELENPVLYQYSVLYEQNPDLAGWIRIDQTNINYPVMQNKEDEEYYIQRDFDKNDDICGLPFMDADCEISQTTKSYLIYGHNMKNGSMFSHLLDYENYDFYQEHSVIHFDTIYEVGIYDIVAVFQTRIAYQDEDIFRYYELIDEKDKEAYDNYIRNVKELSMYDTGINVGYEDQLLVLSTCDRRIENGRFVVVARKRS